MKYKIKTQLGLATLEILQNQGRVWFQLNDGSFELITIEERGPMYLNKFGDSTADIKEIILKTFNHIVNRDKKISRLGFHQDKVVRLEDYLVEFPILSGYEKFCMRLNQLFRKNITQS